MSAKLIELKDYELIPAEDDEQAWAVRILTGNYVETVLRFGTITFNGAENYFNFNFTVVSSPDPDLTSEDTDLQDYAGDLLQSIVIEGIESGSVITKEVDKDE